MPKVVLDADFSSGVFWRISPCVGAHQEKNKVENPHLSPLVNNMLYLKKIKPWFMICILDQLQTGFWYLLNKVVGHGPN